MRPEDLAYLKEARERRAAVRAARLDRTRVQLDELLTMMREAAVSPEHAAFMRRMEEIDHDECHNQSCDAG